jgi:4-amino-4-deoxy-L-arabinose transferase-like glycosyltransferase
MPLFYLIAGAVMTDMALVFFTTAAMTMFWLAVNHSDPKRWHGRAFFVALGGALLAKGLIGPALIGAALCLFVAVSDNRTALVRKIVARLSWIEGIALMLLVAAPWYVTAELKTPGFLQYFVVGEHLSRFIEPSWQGDRFGNAHPQPRGMIWVFFLKATAVWIPYAVYLVLQRWRAGSVPEGPDSRLLSRYLFAWTLAPLVFFTLAGNTIESYALPALPAMALLIARAVPTGVRWFPSLAATNAIAAAVLVSAMALVWLPQKKYSERRSTKAVIDAAHATAAAPPVRLLAIRDLPDSAKFYSKGTAQLVSFERALETLAAPGEVFVMIREVDVIISSNRAAWPEFFLQLDRVGTYGKYVLYRRPAA